MEKTQGIRIMDDEILTIEEVAEYIRVSSRTVYDWAQKGEIPAGKIGTVWRFKKSEIVRWLNEKLTPQAARPAFEENPVQVRNILSPDRVIFIDHAAKRDALVELAQNLATAPQVKHEQELVTEILRREELMSTAIGRGIAIPHVRLNSVTDLVMSVGICRNDIVDFQSIDDTPVRILIMIAAAYAQHSYYLRTLSFFSSKLKNMELRHALLSAGSEQSAYNLLIQ